MVRDVNYTRFPWPLGGIANKPFITISNLGGGRWYNTSVTYPVGTNNGAFRYVKVDRSSVSQQVPLRFYMLNPENGQSGRSQAQVEFNQVQNVDVYGLKGETGAVPAGASCSTVDRSDPSLINTPLLLISNSSNFRIFGQGGNASFGNTCLNDDLGSSALVTISGTSTNNENFLLSNFDHQNSGCVGLSVGHPNCVWKVVKEVINGTVMTTAPAADEWFTLFKRGNPNYAAVTRWLVKILWRSTLLWE